MKPMKMLGVALVAAMALVAFVGASSSSATVLCKTKLINGCAAAGWDYLAATNIAASLETGTTTTLKTTGGVIENTCTMSAVEGPTANTGGANETVQAGVAAAKLVFGGCSNVTAVVAGGELEIHSIAGTTNGTVTAKGFKVTVVRGADCVYGAGTGTDLGTLTGGAMATIDISAVVIKVEGGFLCPATAIWEASYTVTEPAPLYVSET